MFLNYLYVRNFRRFVEKRFELKERFSLLIGVNGQGKTSVLEAFAVALGGFLSSLDEVNNTRNIQKGDIRIDRRMYSYATKKTHTPTIVKCEAKTETGTLTWSRELNSIKGRTTRVNAREISDYTSKLQRLIRETDQEVILPVISYHSTKRFWDVPQEIRSPRKLSSRFVGYSRALESSADYPSFVKWFIQMKFIEFKQRKEIPEVTAITKAIEQFLTILIEPENELRFDYDGEEIILAEGEEKTPFSLLSDGYKNVIGMVSDIAYRMAVLNPHLKEQTIEKTPGVVLIDEIELHLHPKWQWQIIDAFKCTFPQVQFIATSHAPIVISSCEANELIQLYLDEGETAFEYKPGTKGWLVEDILRDVMHVPVRDPDVELVIQKIRELIQKRGEEGLSSEEEMELTEKLQRLDQILPSHDSLTTILNLQVLESKVFGSDD